MLLFFVIGLVAGFVLGFILGILSSFYEDKYTMTEFDKLVKWLKENNYKFTINDDLFSGSQVIVYTESGIRLWDVVYHKYSYGHENGLLEMMGSIVQTPDSVIGYLTAKDCIAIAKGIYDWSNKE